MERRNFLKRLLGGTAAVVGAPLITKGDQLAKEFHEAIPDGTDAPLDLSKVQMSGTVITGSYSLTNEELIDAHKEIMKRDPYYMFKKNSKISSDKI